MRLHTWNNKNLLPVQWVFYQVAFYDGYQYLLVIIIIIIKCKSQFYDIWKKNLHTIRIHYSELWNENEENCITKDIIWDQRPDIIWFLSVDCIFKSEIFLFLVIFKRLWLRHKIWKYNTKDKNQVLNINKNLYWK